MRTAAILIVMTSCIVSCYMPVDGCRDINAANYDVTADEDCEEIDNCCIYPNLNLTISQQVRDTLWIRDSLYTNNLGQVYDIGTVIVMLDDWRIQQGSATVLTREEVDLTYDDVDTTVLDGLVYHRSSEFRYTVGSFIANGIVDQVECTLGTTDRADAIASNADAYVGEIFPDSLLVDTMRYPSVFIRFDSIDARSQMDIYLYDRVDLAFPLAVDLPRGDDLTVACNLDYSEWLDDIDLSLSTEEISEAIAIKLSDAFSVRE